MGIGITIADIRRYQRKDIVKYILYYSNILHCQVTITPKEKGRF